MGDLDDRVRGPAGESSVAPVAPSTTPAEITAKVIASLGSCPDVRLRQLMEALVRHLHQFALETELTQEEWQAGIDALTATGHITDARRQEFILWSDALGLSMLVDAVANPLPEGATESTVLGPFYVPGSPLRGYGDTIAERESGVPVWVHGQVLDVTTGAPIGEAELDVWQNGEDRLYAVQDPEASEYHLRGRFRTRDDGSYAFVAVRPVPYPIPDDGPVGEMLAATGRHPWRPAHIHTVVRADGYRTLVTHIFDDASEYLDSDTVFAVKPSLLRQFIEHGEDGPERPDGVEGRWCSLECDFVLAPGASTTVEDRGRTA